MGNGAETETAPPGGLRVRGYRRRASHMRGVAIALLQRPVVVPGGEEQHLLRARRVHNPARVGEDAAAASQNAEIERFEVRERIVGAFDGHHGLVGRDGVAVVQRAHCQRGPVVAASLEDGDGFIDPADPARSLAEDLHQYLGSMPVLPQNFPGAHEILVGIVPGADQVLREVEGLWIQARPARCGHSAIPALGRPGIGSRYGLAGSQSRGNSQKMSKPCRRPLRLPGNGVRRSGKLQTLAPAPLAWNNRSGERQQPGAPLPWTASWVGPRAKPKAPAVGHLHGIGV